MAIYRRTFQYLRPFYGQTLFALLLSLLTIGIGLLKPWPLKYLIDGLLTAPTEATLSVRAQLEAFAPGWEPAALALILCSAMVAISLLAGLANLFKSYLFTLVGLKTLLKIRTDLYAYLQTLPLKYHDARRSSDSSFRVAYDSQAIQTIYNKGFAGVFGSIITLVGTFIVMLRMDVTLTLIALAVLPLVVMAVRYYAVNIRLQSTTIQERESAVLATVQEGLSSIRVVHAFGRQQYEVNQMRQQAEQSLAANLRLTTTNVSSTLVVGTLMALGTAAMYYFGSLHVLNGTLTVGDLTVFAAYLAMLYGPLESLIYTAWAMQSASAGAARCFEVLDKEDEVSDRPDAIDLPPASDGVRFEQVSFGYDPQQLILQDVNLDIPSGSTIAFVGGTGAGKSTLLGLVPRFYDTTSGSILVGGHNVRDVTKASLRNHIGIVLQDTLLFSTTVRENIAYGRPDATEEEIIEAATRAQAHEFISAMSDGYRSQVGERGNRLSVGQRQRIGIARAFLKNAPILLLDEPTSALDASTEHAIMDTLFELMHGRTTLLVTHRIATIHHLPRIAVLKKGHIAEIGSGPELVERGGAYAELFRSSRMGNV